jgi:hypothetical protein
MKKISLMTVISLALLATSMQGRDWGVTFTYNTASPAGNTAEYIGRYSWVGFGGDLTYHLDDFNEVGLTSGWQRFDVFYRDRLAVFPSGAVFGSQVRTVSAVPLLATVVHTMADPIDPIQPFIKLGAGLYFMNSRLEMGLYRVDNSTTHFGLMPSFGLKFRLDRKSDMVVQLDYNGVFDSGDNIIGEPDNSYSYIGIKVGFRFAQ